MKNNYLNILSEHNPCLYLSYTSGWKRIIPHLASDFLLEVSQNHEGEESSCACVRFRVQSSTKLLSRGEGGTEIITTTPTPKDTAVLSLGSALALHKHMQTACSYRSRY